MPDELTENGLTVKTATELETELKEGFKEIYGKNINLDSNTQDGQRVGLLVQMGTDLRELAKEIYNCGNPDYCRGTVQDVRFKMNNITRKGGTFTIVPITIKVKSTVTLNGLDANYNDVNATAYGVSDNSGNQYFLIDTVTLQKGEHTLPFRAQKIGLVQPVIGTIVNQISIKTEVESVINNSAPTSIGVTQETDENFALRREQSPENRSQNGTDSMRSQLLELEGVTEAYVYSHDYEKYPDGPDADGIKPHYIWVIVEGGANSEIATVIYANHGGAGMKGDVELAIPSVSGQMVTIRFDRTEATPLHIRFNLQETVKGSLFDMDAIKKYIADNLTYKMNELAETSKPTAIARIAIESNGGNGVPVDLEISLNGSNWKDYIPCPTKQNKFTVDTSRITITEIDLV